MIAAHCVKLSASCVLLSSGTFPSVTQFGPKVLEFQVDAQCCPNIFYCVILAPCKSYSKSLAEFLNSETFSNGASILQYVNAPYLRDFAASVFKRTFVVRRTET